MEPTLPEMLLLIPKWSTVWLEHSDWLATCGCINYTLNEYEKERKYLPPHFAVRSR